MIEVEGMAMERRNRNHVKEAIIRKSPGRVRMASGPRGV
jgi:hypothetical protein